MRLGCAYLSIAEAQRLVNACADDFRKLVQAALVTGARYGELAAFQASDFSADNGTVHVRHSKSNKGRHVVLNAEGVAQFKSLATGKAGNDLLLPRSDGDLWRASQQRRPMADACKHGKIAPPISFHGMRHTWASHAVMNGTPLMVVAKNLGHRDTRMVEKHYGHLAPNYIADEIKKNAPTFGLKVEQPVVWLDDQRDARKLGMSTADTSGDRHVVEDIIGVLFFPVFFGVLWLAMRSNTAIGQWMWSGAEMRIEARRQQLSGARPDDMRAGTGPRTPVVGATVVVVALLLLAVWTIIQHAIDKLTPRIRLDPTVAA
jgi:hypothetical protein